MQLDNKRCKPNFAEGSFRAAKMLIQIHGPRILYVGHVSNVMRESVFISTYFCTYETVRSILEQNNFTFGTASIPIAGGIAGAMGWIVSFPLDCIKANIQGSFNIEGSTSFNRVKPVLTVGYEIIASKGFGGLYQGMSPSVIRAFIVSVSQIAFFSNS